MALSSQSDEDLYKSSKGQGYLQNDITEEAKPYRLGSYPECSEKQALMSSATPVCPTTRHTLYMPHCL